MEPDNKIIKPNYYHKYTTALKVIEKLQDSNHQAKIIQEHLAKIEELRKEIKFFKIALINSKKANSDLRELVEHKKIKDDYLKLSKEEQFKLKKDNYIISLEDEITKLKRRLKK